MKKLQLFENIGGNQFKLKEEQPKSLQIERQKFYCIFDGTELIELPDKSDGWESKFKCKKCGHGLHISKDGAWDYTIF